MASYSEVSRHVDVAPRPRALCPRSHESVRADTRSTPDFRQIQQGYSLAFVDPFATFIAPTVDLSLLTLSIDRSAYAFLNFYGGPLLTYSCDSELR
jgi:hypothetical protein